jgi:hypothetical protein
MVKKAILLVLSLMLVTCLVFSFSSITIAAPPDSQDQKGPPVDVVVVVHYPHQPDRVFSGVEGGALAEQTGFSWDGTRWDNPSVNYYVNLNNQNQTFLGGIIASFTAWNTVSSFQAEYKGTTKSSPGSLQAKWNPKKRSFSGAQNVVGFKNLSQYPDAIGITYFWRIDTIDGYRLVEVDTALNTIRDFKWWQTPGIAVGTENSSPWPSSQLSTAYDVDVQNIMTHEAGHWLVLDDLYNDVDNQETMYGYAAEYELKKRSLEAGDIAGIQSIYGP